MLSESLVSDLDLHALKHTLFDLVISNIPRGEQTVCDCKVVRFDCLPHVVNRIRRQRNHVRDTPLGTVRRQHKRSEEDSELQVNIPHERKRSSAFGSILSIESRLLVLNVSVLAFCIAFSSDSQAR